MLINGLFLVCKVEVKEGKNGSYILVNILDVETGEMFSICHKKLADLNKFKMMEKMEIDLKLTSTKYGLNLEIDSVK